MGFSNFRDIEVWQKAKELTVHIYKMTNTSGFKKDYSLCDQIRRAAVSIPSNIAEGNGRSSDKEFARFLNIAKGSLSELQTQMIIALEIGYISDDEYNIINKECESIIRMIGRLLTHLNKVQMS